MGKLKRSLYLGLYQVHGHASACAAAWRKMGGPMVSSIFLISLTVLPLSSYSLIGSSETSTCKPHLGEKKKKTLILLFLDPSVSVTLHSSIIWGAFCGYLLFGAFSSSFEFCYLEWTWPNFDPDKMKNNDNNIQIWIRWVSEVKLQRWFWDIAGGKIMTEEEALPRNSQSCTNSRSPRHCIWCPYLYLFN